LTLLDSVTLFDKQVADAWAAAHLPAGCGHASDITGRLQAPQRGDRFNAGLNHGRNRLRGRLLQAANPGNQGSEGYSDATGRDPGLALEGLKHQAKGRGSSKSKSSM
jgi:hypothetical protein